jgi:hypothetical protein
MIPAPPKAPPAVIPITLPKLLLVEGSTPMHFFEALLQHLGLEKRVEIRSFGGVRDLKAVLPALLITPGFGQVTSLSVVRDAEDDAVAARQSVATALAGAALAPRIRTSIFILPDDSNPGMIETLCMQAVKNEPSLAAACTCVEELFVCLGKNSVPLPALPRLAKNYAQAYLATRLETQMFPGLAAYRGYWPLDNPVFDPLKQFLTAL